jgi:hypothetical protein
MKETTRMITREELIDKIADLYIDHSDSDGAWEPCDITEAVMSLLTTEGRDRLSQCPDCSTWFPIQTYDDCPYWDDHQCSGGCGETNNNCTCENCDDCGYYECECPVCTKCSEKPGVCKCPEEEAVFA